MYEFSLDRRKIILLASGLVLAAILLFVAGLTVGLAHTANAGHTTAKAPAQTATAKLPVVVVQNQQTAQSAEAETATGSPARLKPATTAAAQQGTIASAADTRPIAARKPAPVRPHSQPSRPEPVSTKAAAGPYSLQAGAFSRETNARALQQRLVQVGIAARVQRRKIGSHDLYVVETGHYTSAAAAASAAHRIQQRIGIAPVVRH